MTWLRALLVAARLSGPYWLAPWRSPLLRWRVETYGVCDAQGRILHADELTASHVIAFLWRRRSALWRFLCWAARL